MLRWTLTIAERQGHVRHRNHDESIMPLPAYDTSNVFARILRGELPAHKVYEDEATLAFMTSCHVRTGMCW